MYDMDEITLRSFSMKLLNDYYVCCVPNFALLQNVNKTLLE